MDRIHKVHRVAGAAALAGLAAAAAGQGVTLTFSADSSSVSVGDIVTWTVSASFTGYSDPTAYFGGFAGSFDSVAPGSAELVSFTNLLPFEGTTPVGNGASIGSVNIFQAALLGSGDNANPISIATFQTRVLASVGLNSIAAYGVAGVATVFADDGIFTLGDEYTNITVFSDGVPTPGAAAVLACGGLFSMNRRRRAVAGRAGGRP